MQRHAAPFFALFAFVLGCSSDKEFEAAPPFRDDDDVGIWATTGSAVAVYSHGYEPIGVADGKLSYSDPECPATSDDGTTLVVRGGCTDTNERKWTGSLTVRREGDDRRLTFDGFDDITGTMELRRVGPSEREFDADLVIGGVTTIGYSGTVSGDYGAPTTWDGSGRVERDGFLPPTGAVDVTTQAEVVDDAVCSGAPVSGTTTLRARGDTAVVTYDGASDCDADQKAKLSVNGKDRGLVSGINCAVAGAGRKAPFGSVGSLLVLAALLVFRRRRH